MIIRKSPAEIEAMKEAGRVSAKVLREVGAQVRPGVSTLELDELADTLFGGHEALEHADEQEHHHHTHAPASHHEHGHHLLQVEDLSVGFRMDGWVGDNAWTYAVGKISPEKKRLLDVTERCMWAGLDAARPGNRLGDIGHAVQSVAEEAGYGVVREYVGHGIGRDMHEDPNVPNFGRKHTGVKLEAGMVLAIEPMINLGTYKTRQMPDGWLVCTRDGLPSAHFEKTVAITEDGPVILTTEEGHRRPV